MNLGLLLYIMVALSTAVSSAMGSDEAAKYISAETLFWIRTINSIVGGVAITLKGYTSQGFQDWLNKKNVNQASP